jgi:hypothetical protein
MLHTSLRQINVMFDTSPSAISFYTFGVLPSLSIHALHHTGMKIRKNILVLKYTFRSFIPDDDCKLVETSN